MAHVTVNNNGVLISKDGKAGSDLIDEAIANQGQLRTVTPVPVEQRRQPPRTFPQGTPSTPGKAPAKPTPAPSSTPQTTPATTPGTNP